MRWRLKLLLPAYDFYATCGQSQDWCVLGGGNHRMYCLVFHLSHPLAVVGVLWRQFRAWVRKVLNQSALQYSLQELARQRRTTEKYYSSRAAMRSQPFVEAVVKVLGGLEKAAFDLPFDLGECTSRVQCGGWDWGEAGH